MRVHLNLASSFKTATCTSNVLEYFFRNPVEKLNP